MTEFCFSYRALISLTLILLNINDSFVLKTCKLDFVRINFIPLKVIEMYAKINFNYEFNLKRFATEKEIDFRCKRIRH